MIFIHKPLWKKWKIVNKSYKKFIQNEKSKEFVKIIQKWYKLGKNLKKCDCFPKFLNVLKSWQKLQKSGILPS